MIMGGTGVIDNFLGVFTSYIDSGFGLLGGEVAFIATTLIVIDVTLAALFWAWGADDDDGRAAGQEDAVRRRLRLHHRQLEQPRAIVFESFAGLGLMASGTGFPSRISCARAARADRPRRRAAAARIHLRPDGLDRRLRELHPDRLPVLRLGAGYPRLLHPGHPALRHPDRVQADHAWPASC